MRAPSIGSVRWSVDKNDKDSEKHGDAPAWTQSGAGSWKLKHQILPRMIWAEWRRRRGWLVTLMREELDTVSCKVYRDQGEDNCVSVNPAFCHMHHSDSMWLVNTRQSVKVCQGFLGFASGEMQRNLSSKHSGDPRPLPAPCLHLARAAECWRGFWESWQCPVFSVGRVTGCSSWLGSVSRSPESFAIKSLLKNRFYKLVTNCMHSAHDEQILVRQPSHVMKSVLNTRHWSRFIPA